MSAVQAIATGRAPRPRHGFLAQRALARLTSVPRPVTLGLASPAARPGRTLVTVAAVLFGAAAVTFGVGLATSLDHAFAAIRGEAMPVQVAAVPSGETSGPGGPGRPTKRIVVVSPGASLTTARQHAVTAAIDAQPGTLHYLTETADSLTLPGLSSGDGGARIIARGGGDPSWTGLALISGAWYSQSPGAAQIDVNTLFLTDTGTNVGDTYTLVNAGRRVTAKIVGEVIAPGDEVNVYLSPSTLAALDPAAAGVGHYDVGLKPGVSPYAYASALNATLGDTYEVDAEVGGGRELAAVVTLVGLLTLLIVVVAGLGVLNTVALQVRERAHDIGVFKALGMTPRQTLTMIACSVAVTGLAAGVIAVPAGVLLHHGVLPAMAHAANSGYPSSLISVYSVPELIGLALAGLVIAVAGALAPAAWAARSGTAAALRTE
jgi:putative ABC transport system permease protein